MTEPSEIADRAEPVADGVWWWGIRNSNIGGGASSSHLIATGGDVVLVDPVRLAPDQLDALPAATGIVLTAKCHQRSAWRYRREFGVEVWAPQGAPAADEEPDHRYAAGDRIPAGLEAVLTPRPEPVHYCMLARERDALVCSDLLMGDPEQGLEFVPGRFHDDPAQTRASTEALLGLPFSLLCLDHGRPFADGPRAIQQLLDRAG
jgi:glyoxylase-like metal-dependent hydrolase (beta-lactamase superfamily II)